MLLLALIPFASAAPLLVLPPGEDRHLWDASAQLAGLDLVDGAPRIEVRDLGSVWELRVGDAPAVRVAEPRDEMARERLASLARSLARAGIQVPPPDTTLAPDPEPAIPRSGAPPSRLRASQRTSAPPPPPSRASASAADVPGPSAAGASPDSAARPSDPAITGATLPPAPTNEVVADAPPVAAPTADAPGAQAGPESPPSTAVVPAPAAAPVPAEPMLPPAQPPRPPPRFVARAGGQVRARPDTTVAAGVNLEAGLQIGRWDFQLGGSWYSAQDLHVVDAAASMETLAVDTGVAWAGRGGVAPAAIAAVGATARRYTADAAPLATLWTPYASLQLGLRAHITESVALEAGVVGQIDLGRTLVQVGEADPLPLTPWEIAGAVGLRFSAP